MNAVLSKIDRLGQSLASLSLGIAALLTIMLVFLTVEQVIARYFFASSSIALQELELFIFGATFLLAMGAALRQEKHVRVDIFYDRFSSKGKAVVNTIGCLIFLLPMASCLIYFGIEFCRESYAYTNLLPQDRISSSVSPPGSRIYELILPLEIWLRQGLLTGETSANPGGLEGIWLAKAFIPLGGILLFLEGILFMLRPLINPTKGS